MSARVSPTLVVGHDATFLAHDAPVLLQVRTQPSKLRGTPLDVSVSLPSKHAAAGGLGPIAMLHIPYNHIAVNLTYHNLGEQIVTFPERRPREFNIIVATCKTWTADMVVQLLDRRRVAANGISWRFDWQRSFTFAIFGFFYIGLMQWCLYVTFLSWLFPDAIIFANAPFSEKLIDSQGQIDMMGQVLVDNLLINVFIYFPLFYTFKQVIQGSSSFASRVESGLEKYRASILKDNLVSCAVWVPCDLFIFACPMYLRMPLEHGVSFGWTMFMSFTRGSSVNNKDELTKPVA